MDSQENALLQGAQVEKEAEQTTAQNAEAAADDQKVENAKVYKTKKEVVERLKEIAASDENPDKDGIDLLKTVFYKLHITEREARMKEYIDGGGDPEAYQLTVTFSSSPSMSVTCVEFLEYSKVLLLEHSSKLLPMPSILNELFNSTPLVEARPFSHFPDPKYSSHVSS